MNHPFFTELCSLGFRPRELVGLGVGQLAELVQASFTYNAWSPEARAKARQARKQNKKLDKEARRLLAQGVRKAHQKLSRPKQKEFHEKMSDYLKDLYKRTK